MKSQRNGGSKVSCFCNWISLQIKPDVLAEHGLHAVPAQQERLAGASFCYKAIMSRVYVLLNPITIMKVGGELC